MTDLSGPVQAAMITTLRSDPGVILAFGGSRVRVFGTPPVNAPTPYVVVGGDDILPIRAERFQLQEIDIDVHVWSLTDPPGSAEARAIGGAAVSALLKLAAPTGVNLYSIDIQRSQHLTDRDGKTSHGVHALRLTAAPA